MTVVFGNQRHLNMSKEKAELGSLFLQMKHVLRFCRCNQYLLYSADWAG